MALKTRVLNEADRAEVLTLLWREPIYNITMMSDIAEGGLEKQEGSPGSDYVGVWKGQDLIGVACAYETGSFLAYTVTKAALAPLTLYFEELEIKPRVFGGRRVEVEHFSRKLSAKNVLIKNYENELMTLTGANLSEISGPPARQVRSDDLDEVLELQKRFETDFFGEVVNIGERWDKTIAKSVEAGNVFVCEEGDKIVSKAQANATLPLGWEDRDDSFAGAYVVGVYTEPEHRGQGYATSCVSELCRHLLRTVEVIVLDVGKDNAPAQKIYRKLGFNPVSEYIIIVASRL